MALKVNTVVSQWKNFDLQSLQRELDGEAALVAQRQDESDAARKTLIELSREFKRSASEETRAQVAPLLRSFQQEIDRLGQRSKAAEVAFLGVYKRLVDVTDPVPFLEATVTLQGKASKLADVELEVKQLRETLAEYNEEFRTVRNQEVTIKQLKERVKQAEQGLEQAVQSRLDEREAQLRSQFDERERELAELNRVTSRRLAEAESRCIQLQSTVTELQSELFDAKAGSEVVSQAKLDEIEILMQDLDRSNQRAALAEKELSILKEQFERQASENKARLGQVVSPDQANEAPPSLPNMDTPLDVMGRPSLLELAAKEKEVQTLIDDVQKLQSTLNQLRESSARQLSHFEEELQVRSKHIQRLEAQLEAQKDYQEIRRELSILKSIEFPHLPANTPDEEDVKSTDKASSKPLEVLLLERNKALQSENTALKVANTDLQVRTEQLTKENSGLQQEVQTQKELIEQLELDLSSLQNLSTANRGEAEGQSNDWVAEAVKDIHVLGPAGTPTTASATDSDTTATLLPILQAQRERFRQRNEELEALNLEKQQQMTLLQSELERLRKDNVALYEKVRFLQSYSGQRATKGTSVGFNPETEEQYERQYEDRLDPFATFSRRERQRKLAQLGPFERITYSMGQMILSNRVARTAGVIYFSALHVLVFLVLYRLAYAESTQTQGHGR